MTGAWFRPAVFGLLGAVVAGCGGGSAAVAGKVTAAGKTVVRGNVAFLNTTTNQTVSAEIQPDGSYQISELPAGSYKVAVSSPDPGAAADPTGDRDRFKSPAAKKKAAGPASNWFPIPERYADPDKSGLTVTLTGGGNTYDIKLD